MNFKIHATLEHITSKYNKHFFCYIKSINYEISM